MKTQPRPSPVGLSGIGTALAERRAGLDELRERGLIDSTPATLNELGFERSHLVAEPGEVLELAKRAVSEALADAGLAAKDVDLVIWTSALADGHQCRSEGSDPGGLERFCYTGSWLQNEFGFDKATVAGAAQQGCAGMFGALRTARAMLVAEPDLQHVLCVGADALPTGASREILYNVISDAAVACVVSRDSACDRWLGFHQITKGYYWDTPSKQKEIAAAYFPTARAAIAGLLEKTGTAPDEIDVVIPNGIQAPSWPVLLKLSGIPEDRLFHGEDRFGHTISADNFIHLEHIRRDRGLPKGSLMLLFTYGFGSSWSAMLLEH